MMNWIPLESADQIEHIKQQQGYSLIFKHSTRCSISMMVKKRFEFDLDKIPESSPIYFLDLIKFRDLSNQVAVDFKVYHESPQLLLIKDGECILYRSHGAVSVEEAILVMD
jgi:bacillithiol system protein YtxJ